MFFELRFDKIDDMVHLHLPWGDRSVKGKLEKIREVKRLRERKLTDLSAALGDA
jgi:hypothetical protein